MVFLKRTELSNKLKGYKTLANVFDKKIEKLNKNSVDLQQKMESVIKKKKLIVDKIELIINKLETENTDAETKDEISTLVAIKRKLEDDIVDFKEQKSYDIQSINNILTTAGIEGISEATALLSCERDDISW